MWRQGNNLQSKGVEDSQIKELNEMEASKLSDIELKTMVIRMLKELTVNYKEHTGNYSSMKKEIETINKDQEEKKNSTSEIKNIPEGITSIQDDAEDQISELEDKVERNTQVEQLQEKRLKK